ncbi:sulfatase [Candidatus Omnitrophota bacterium]
MLLIAKKTDSNKDHTRYNVLFILIETLRADHLGCYGYKRNTSPNIDKIAEQGIRFTDFYTVCPWTNPTVASLFTGRYPQAIFPPKRHKQAIHQAIPEELDTLAEVLKNEGYNTIALVDHPGINQNLNYSQGFNEFIPLFNKRGWHEWAGSKHSDISEDLSLALEENKNGRFFIYLHLLYPHLPYVPPAPFKDMFGPGFKDFTKQESEGLINMYDGEIRYTDELVGNIFDHLRENNLLKNTYVIITSDHGEGFWEHGTSEHGNSLYNELLKVPLIIYPPGGRKAQPATIDKLASNIDLFPTIMDFAKIENFPKADGKSLVRYFKKGAGGPAGIIFSENPHSVCVDGMSCQSDQYKIIFTSPSHNSKREVYDIRKDPFEKNNLVSMGIPDAARMEKLLIDHKKDTDRKRMLLEQKDKKLDKASSDKLKSLGYLQ